MAKNRPTKRREFNGAKLLRLRTAANLSQAELGEKIDAAPIDISRYERGLTNPSFDVVCRLADALGVSTNDFRGG